MIVHVMLRDNPSALACSSRERNPVARRTSRSSLIFAHCRAFMSKTSLAFIFKPKLSFHLFNFTSLAASFSKSADKSELSFRLDLVFHDDGEEHHGRAAGTNTSPAVSR